MDSLTQIVLGASVGEAVCGRKIGNKAMLWGAAAGTIPDLDILLNPWLDMVQQLSFHRSISHSFFFAVVASPLLGLLLQRIYSNQAATFKDWTWLFFFGFTTHAILDSFTTWGTQLFWPFSNYGVAFYNVFVVDPFYTVPFLLFVAAAAFYSRKSEKRKRLNYAGLLISSIYILFTFTAKARANAAFEQSLREQSINYTSYISKPTPLNAFLWAVTAKTKDGFYTGFYSIFDRDKEIDFHFEPHNRHLVKPYLGNEKMERLLQITKGYYVVSPTKKGIYISDLRFGQFDGWRESGGQYVFVYHVWEGHEGLLEFKEINYRPKPDKAYLTSYIKRIIGNQPQL